MGDRRARATELLCPGIPQAGLFPVPGELLVESELCVEITSVWSAVECRGWWSEAASGPGQVARPGTSTQLEVVAILTGLTDRSRWGKDGASWVTDWRPQ